MMPLIIGNQAVAAGGVSCTVTVDEALDLAVSVGVTNIETLGNPYAYVTSMNVTNSGYVSALGVPAVTCAAGLYFWLQTWGPCWVTSDGLTADDTGDRDVYFRSNGSLSSRTEATGDIYQRAGTVIDASGSGASNAPFVQLEISF